MVAVARLLLLSIFLPPVSCETPSVTNGVATTDRLIVWTIHFGGNTSHVLRALRLSVRTAQPHARRMGLGMLVLYTSSHSKGQPLECTHFQDVGAPCKSVELKPSARCADAPPALAAAQLYVAKMAAVEGETGLEDLNKYIRSRGIIRRGTPALQPRHNCPQS
jgi:hypothetical protein